MSLIKIIEYGYGVDDKTLSLKIAIPRGSHIKDLYFASSADILKYNSPKVEHIFEKVSDWYDTNNSKDTFLKMFTYVKTLYSDRADIAMDVYELKDDFYWGANIGIPIDKQGLNFITLELQFNPNEGFVIPPHCGFDNSCLVYPIYNCLGLKLKALDFYKGGCECEFNREFVDKILQIKAIETALEVKDFIYASKLWGEFNNSKISNIVKNCNCYAQ